LVNTKYLFADTNPLIGTWEMYIGEYLAESWVFTEDVYKIFKGDTNKDSVEEGVYKITGNNTIECNPTGKYKGFPGMRKMRFELNNDMLMLVQTNSSMGVRPFRGRKVEE
jgi:hypothetical protein